MKKEITINSYLAKLVSILAILLLLPAISQARDVEYRGEEMTVSVTPGEPTQIEFPSEVAGGFRKRLSTLSLDKKDQDLIIFANEALTEEGEAIIVRLEDGRSYSIRVRRASGDAPRDPFVRVYDDRVGVFGADEETPPPYKSTQFRTATPNQVSGLMREMMLVAEFGKKSIPGYRVSDRYRGETILNDGTLKATIDKIFIGPDYWGYVLNAVNMLDINQQVNPASFRLDGTRAISMDNWELSPRPLNIEQQIAGKHTTTIYVITRARR